MNSPELPDDRGARPVPAYGEYASSEDAAAALRSSWPAPSGAPVTRHPEAPAKPVEQPRDRWLSIALLAFGLYCVINVVTFLLNAEPQMQTLYDTYSLGSYVAPPTLNAAKAVGIASQVLLYCAVLPLTVRRMQRGALSFWIPLVGGFVAFVVFGLVYYAIIAGDHALLDAMRARFETS